MKKLMTTIALILLIWMFLLCVLLIFRVARAEEAHELIPIKITAYCLQGTMANGEKVHEGAVAYRKEDIGRMCRLYSADMQLIGEFTVCDTGKKGGAVRKGLVVDVWRPTKQECYQMTQCGYIEFFEPEGGTDD